MPDTITMLRECAEQFRFYEKQHTDKVPSLLEQAAMPLLTGDHERLRQQIEGTRAKAAVNADFAERIERRIAEIEAAAEPEAVRSSDDIFDLIVLWAAAKDLTAPERAAPQMVKMIEELGETAAAVARRNLDGVKDGIGDCVVVLTILAAQHGLTVTECIQAAWDEIKGRTGKTVNGIFVKDNE